MRALVLIALLAGCGGDDDDSSAIDAPLPDAGIPDGLDAPGSDMGAFYLEWTITFGGAPATCAAVAADIVRVESASVTGTDVYPDSFDCAAGMGLTGILPIDDYDVTITLYSGGTVLDEYGPIPASVEVVGQIGDLGSIPFAL